MSEELKQITQQAEEYAKVKTPLRIKDYSAATKRIYNAYIAGVTAHIDSVDKNKITHFHIADNSNAFCDWLDKTKIEYQRNGHYTTISIKYDIFSLGMEFGIYKNENLKTIDSVDGGRKEDEIKQMLFNAMDKGYIPVNYAKGFEDWLKTTLLKLDEDEKQAASVIFIAGAEFQSRQKIKTT